MKYKTFYAALLARARQAETRRWLKRSPCDDLCADVAADDNAPTDDDGLYRYLVKHAGGYTMLNDEDVSLVDWLWARYRGVRL
jgi:hypothetical protein